MENKKSPSDVGLVTTSCFFPSYISKLRSEVVVTTLQAETSIFSQFFLYIRDEEKNKSILFVLVGNNTACARSLLGAAPTTPKQISQDLRRSPPFVLNRESRVLFPCLGYQHPLQTMYVKKCHLKLFNLRSLSFKGTWRTSILPPPPPSPSRPPQGFHQPQQTSLRRSSKSCMYVQPVQDTNEPESLVSRTKGLT